MWIFFKKSPIIILVVTTTTFSSYCRLAKLMSQVEWSKTGINFNIDKTYYPWIQKSPPPSARPEEDEEDLIMKKFYVSLGQVK